MERLQQLIAAVACQLGASAGVTPLIAATGQVLKASFKEKGTELSVPRRVCGRTQFACCRCINRAVSAWLQTAVLTGLTVQTRLHVCTVVLKVILALLVADSVLVADSANRCCMLQLPLQ